MTQKRTLDSFFAPETKKPRTSEASDEPATYSTHQHYPHPIRNLPQPLRRELASLPARTGRKIKDQPDLDLLYFEPFIPSHLAKKIFEFLRSELPFYRVEYKINRGGIQTDIRTPRYTTVFGLDETSRFADNGDNEDGTVVVDAKSGFRVRGEKRYDKNPPRPIPKCLDDLRKSTEAATGCAFNFCLVNYYASGADSVNFHSDDERFLGPDPAIASFSLGAKRDFVMKHKPAAATDGGRQDGPKDKDIKAGTPSPLPAKTLKYPLASEDAVLMRGPTQSHWPHSVPKRGGKNPEDGGRINITFRRAMVKGGTENYYNYNVGTGPVYRWEGISREMRTI